MSDCTGRHFGSGDGVERISAVEITWHGKQQPLKALSVPLTYVIPRSPFAASSYNAIKSIAFQFVQANPFGAESYPFNLIKQANIESLTR